MRESNKGKQPRDGRSPQQLSRGEARAAGRARPGTATSAGPVVSPHLRRPLLLSLSPPLPPSSLSTYRPPAQDSLLPSLLPGVQESPSSELHETGHDQPRHLRTRPYTTSQLLRAQPPRARSPASLGRNYSHTRAPATVRKCKFSPGLG